MYLYEEAFLHAKHITFDDEIAILGSSNVDVRSFVLNAEVSLIAFDKTVVEQLRHPQSRYFASSKALSLRDWKKRPIASKVAENLARLAAMRPKVYARMCSRALRPNGGPPAALMIDATHVKAHRLAAGGKGGANSRRSAARAAAGQPKSMLRSTSRGGRAGALRGRRRIRQRRPSRFADRAGNQAGHPQQPDPKAPPPVRPNHLPSSQCSRTDLLPPQGLVPHRKLLRQARPQLLRSRHHRQHRQLLVMDPEPRPPSPGGQGGAATLSHDIITMQSVRKCPAPPRLRRRASLRDRAQPSTASGLRERIFRVPRA